MYLSESRYPVSGSNRLACVPVCTPSRPQRAEHAGYFGGRHAGHVGAHHREPDLRQRRRVRVAHVDRRFGGLELALEVEQRVEVFVFN